MSLLAFALGITMPPPPTWKVCYARVPDSGSVGAMLSIALILLLAWWLLLEGRSGRQ